MKKLPALAVALLTWTSAAVATPFNELSPGGKVPDNVVRVGRYSIELPAGEWVVTTRSTTRAGSQSGSSAAPMQQVVGVALVEADQVRAFVFLRAPASTFVGVSRWNDDPCKTFGHSLVKDTLQQTHAMPECFAITDWHTAAFTEAANGALSDAGRWAKSSNLKYPADRLRVYYTKYYGGDFLHANFYLAGSQEQLRDYETWGRAAALSLQQAVRRWTDVAAIPPLPGSHASAAAPASSPLQKPVAPDAARMEATMRELKSLYEKGLLTKAEYDSKRLTVLDGGSR